MTHMMPTKQQHRSKDRLVWQVGALVLAYGLTMNLLLTLLPDTRGAVIALCISVPLLLAGLWFSVRGTLRAHWKKNKN